jgi:RNA polymerase sigma factor (sigma-70 family)
LAALMDAQPKSRASVNRERNAELLCELLTDSEHLLRGQARQHAQLPEDAEDALQCAYMRFIERYRGNCEPLAWLYTTVKREAWAMRRKPSRKRELSIDCPVDCLDHDARCDGGLAADAAQPEELAIRAERLAERKRLLRDLKPDERRALLLFACGCSYGEICELTGWTYTKVNRCMAEGRAALRSAGG